MTQISKLNLKIINFEKRNNEEQIKQILVLSNGKFIIISNFLYRTYLSLYIYENNNFIKIDNLQILSYPPKIIYELKNKTIAFTGIDHLAFYKIKNNKIYRNSYHYTDNEGNLINEIIQIKELENKKIILLNKIGNIYIVQKISKKQKKYITLRSNGSLEIFGQIIDGIPEYMFVDVIRNGEIEYNINSKWYIYKMGYRMAFSKNNIIYFSNSEYRDEFMIDFSEKKYIKNKINLFHKYYKDISPNKTFDFNNGFIFCLYCNNLLILDKNNLEIVSIYEMFKNIIITKIINIEKNIYLCYLNDNRLGLIDFSNKDFYIKEIKNLEIKGYNTYLLNYNNIIFIFSYD